MLIIPKITNLTWELLSIQWGMIIDPFSTVNVRLNFRTRKSMSIWSCPETWTTFSNNILRPSTHTKHNTKKHIKYIERSILLMILLSHFSLRLTGFEVDWYELFIEYYRPVNGCMLTYLDCLYFYTHTLWAARSRLHSLHGLTEFMPIITQQGQRQRPEKDYHR